MATSSQLAEAQAAVAGLLAVRPRAVDPVLGGGNNRLYRVETADGRAFALKTYLRRHDDPRDRLGHEWGGLEFLFRHGVTCVPRPVAVHRTRGAALYSWIDGRRVQAPGEPEIDAAVAFVVALKNLAAHADAAALPQAAEACLSAGELIGQVERRFDRLLALDEPRLGPFLVRSVLPAYEQVLNALQQGYHTAGWRLDAEIDPAFRTLSPSDFGFHNALASDDRLVFLDFEYFGWDDPVKLTADFLHHPGMVLDAGLRRRFLAGAVRAFADDPAFGTRLALLYPLYGLRWVAILLNEFLPERWARRAYAGGADRGAVLARQLDKAQAKLADLGGLPHDA